MSYLRTQKAGSQEPWEIEELRAGLENFNTEHGRYPTAPEIDTYPYLPSARTIERRFGGVIGLRKTLGLDTQSDLREVVSEPLQSTHGLIRLNKRYIPTSRNSLEGNLCIVNIFFLTINAPEQIFLSMIAQMDFV
jgi:hypothetical protein